MLHYTTLPYTTTTATATTALHHATSTSCGEVTAANIATTLRNTTPTTLRSISGFALQSVTRNNQTLLKVSYFWNFRRRLLRYYWRYIYIYSTTTISQTMNWSCHVWNSTLSKVAFRFVPTTQNSIVHETKLEHCANMFVLLLMPTIHNWVWDGMMFVQIKISTCFFLIGTIR